MDLHKSINIDRKEDHISLSLQSRLGLSALDSRFEYDPVNAVHPDKNELWKATLGLQEMNYPVWISSMTGGTGKAKSINANLAQLCAEFKLGMGLGSCRKLIDEPECRSDFQVRSLIGSQPLYANLGIAQIEQWLSQGKAQNITDILSIVEADGLIIHINPMQEWMQAEGDRFNRPPIDTIKDVLNRFDVPIIVKEVGQGMGYKALLSLMSLPLAAIELAAFGGTNFALLELLRGDEARKERFTPLANIGHSAEEMIHYTNQIVATQTNIQCHKLIISGGVSHFLDAYYLMSKSNIPALYGMASAFLKHALISYESLQQFMIDQIDGLMLSKAFLSIKAS
ncbi:MAG: type 2 isopentenyl-diphosphate Delta-isomerase [Saprospiraceae bacterium]|uniref:Type 2 isopentenyl-diphosphate Delta-isomerase n=1 Tax=Candidatus Defluviibacterium haderslevense TaxID=2981993 RepID=A0A9D7SCG8_9BACT|nr:type 2 isopentenyl-diphosphate Delta-isomerase [Candidatus Defluviibacterium haderslevense]